MSPLSLFPVIDDPDGFSLALWEAVRLDQIHPRRDQDVAAKLLHDPAPKRLELVEIALEELRCISTLTVIESL